MTNELILTLEEEPAASDVETLRNGLTAHALPTTKVPGFQPLAMFARTADGDLVGGVQGSINWTWLDVSLLWVEESQRGRGLGGRLLRGFEMEAVKRGCRQAHLETFGFQARPFYERHGYRLFATLDDYAAGQAKFFMRKELKTTTPPEAP